MCCFFSTLVLLGPRAAVLVWWLIDPDRWSEAFSSWLWPILGFIFAPWTTLSWAAIAPNGLVGFDWIILGLGILLDIGSYSYGAFERRSSYAQY